jgi:hypothetical protein
MADDLQRCKIEWLKCSKSPAYWVHSYVQIYNATDRAWLPFHLWPAQHAVLEQLTTQHWLIVLKARQLGLSWLVLSYVLWTMLFRPAATALIFSRREDEAIDLVNFRLKGIYERLPAWMQARSVTLDTKLDWRLSNGSNAKGFPTTGARSYTGTIVVIDEADFIEDLDKLMNAVKPTIDAGGQLIMISTVDKAQPNSPFKRIYRGARKGTTEWRHVFLPWHSRPGRDAAWYAAQRADVLARTGALDDLHQEYPATDTEALAPRTLDKRIPARWIEDCYVEQEPLYVDGAPALAELEVYAPPQFRRQYVIGGDPAEGNPTSDDSALTVLDLLTGEECAALAGKLEPSTFAAALDEIGCWYNDAAVMVERNNHGHAVLQWLEEHSRLRRLHGHDDKPGWLSNKLGKTLMYNQAAEMFRDGTTVLHSFDSYYQLAGIEGSTLLAPPGDRDDRADSYALANVGRAAALEDAGNFQVLPAPNIYGSRERANMNTERGHDGRNRGVYGARR